MSSYKCWVPNQNMTDCVLVTTSPDPVGSYCDPKKDKPQCVRDCVHANKKSVKKTCHEDLYAEKCCTKDDCLEMCKHQPQASRNQCLQFCETVSYLDPVTYNYECSNDYNEINACIDSLKCRFENPPMTSCKVPICSDSCNIVGRAIDKPGNEECQYFSNDYCYRSDNGGRTWKYQFREQRRLPDNQPNPPIWNPLGPYTPIDIDTNTCSDDPRCIPEYGEKYSDGNMYFESCSPERRCCCAGSGRHEKGYNLMCENGYCFN